MAIVQPTTALERLRRALEDHGCTVRGNAAQCPAPDHDDRQASLSIGQGRGKAILKCHKGCATDVILEALGMSAADLRDEPSGGNRGFQVVAEYRYTDERGELLFVKERRVPKDFRLRRPGGQWGLGDVRRVLYNLPAVLDAMARGQPVYVVEGEKDADAIGRAGAVATCNFEGAAKDGQRPKWRSEYGDVLRGAVVIVVADKDEAGYAHAAAIRADLGGKAASVTVVEAAEGKDAADHLAAGRGLDEFRAVQLPGDDTTEGLQAAPQIRIRYRLRNRPSRCRIFPFFLLSRSSARCGHSSTGALRTACILNARRRRPWPPW
jgi:5S rRNA maturation endonuclease (ribonuclease M5)